MVILSTINETVEFHLHDRDTYKVYCVFFFFFYFIFFFFFFFFAA